MANLILPPKNIVSSIDFGSTSVNSTYVNAGGTLTISGGILNVGCSSKFNDSLVVNGTLNISGGTTNINGSLDINNGANFAHSGGDILIDGNNGGSTTNSVRNDKPLFGIGTYTQPARCQIGVGC